MKFPIVFKFRYLVLCSSRLFVYFLLILTLPSSACKKVLAGFLLSGCFFCVSSKASPYSVLVVAFEMLVSEEDKSEVRVSSVSRDVLVQVTVLLASTNSLTPCLVMISVVQFWTGIIC